MYATPLDTPDRSMSAGAQKSTASQIATLFSALAAAALVIAAGANPAAAGSRPTVPDTYVAEGRGCTWVRGAMTCSRFCYMEVDGRRYCQNRSREAFPQATGYYWGQATGERPRRYRPNVEVSPDYRGRPWIRAPRRDIE